jgi:flagellar biosynthesis protein FlhA
VPELLVDHLQHLVETHAAEILTREEVARLVSDLRARSPVLVDELIPAVMKLGEVHKVLQALLRERVSVRDLETILEVLADSAGRGSPIQLAEEVRRRLARSICDSLAGRHRVINALFLDPALEELLQSSLQPAAGEVRLLVEPEVADALVSNIAEEVSRRHEAEPGVAMVCPGTIRTQLRQLVAGRLPRLAVLAYEEVTDEYQLEACGTVALEKVG